MENYKTEIAKWKKEVIYMDFAAWEPIYEEILEDFGFDRAGDEEAARILSRMLTEKNTVSLSELKTAISGKPALICGNAPKLRKELSEINLSGFTVIAADGAAAVLMDTAACLKSYAPTLTAIQKLTLKKRSGLASRARLSSSTPTVTILISSKNTCPV
jgi:hypothetical protein